MILNDQEFSNEMLKNISNKKDDNNLKKKQVCLGSKSLTKGGAFDQISNGKNVFYQVVNKKDGKKEYKFFTNCSNGCSNSTLCRSHKDQKIQGKNPLLLFDDIQNSSDYQKLLLKDNKDFFKNQIEKNNRQNNKNKNKKLIENENNNSSFDILWNLYISGKLPLDIKNEVLIFCNNIIQNNKLSILDINSNKIDNSLSVKNIGLLNTIEKQQEEYNKYNNLSTSNLNKSTFLTKDNDKNDENSDSDTNSLLEEDEVNIFTDNNDQNLDNENSDSDNNSLFDNEEDNNNEKEIDAIEINTLKDKLLYLNPEGNIVYEPEDGEFNELGILKKISQSYSTIEYMHQHWTVLREMDNPIDTDEKNKKIYVCSLSNNVFDLNYKYLGILTKKKNNTYTITKNKLKK